MRRESYFLAPYVVLFIFVMAPSVTGYYGILGYEDGGRIRVKRNLICVFGLTGIIKDVFYHSLKELDTFDPLEIGDSPDGRLRDGVFYGLSTLTNATGMDVRCDEENVIFNTTLRMTDAKVRYKWSRKVLLRFSGSVWTTVDKIQFPIEITLDLKEGTLKLSNIIVTKLEGFKFGFTGLGLLNPVVSCFVNILYSIWSKKITSEIASLIQNAFQSQLNKVHLPF